MYGVYVPCGQIPYIQGLQSDRVTLKPRLLPTTKKEDSKTLTATCNMVDRPTKSHSLGVILTPRALTFSTQFILFLCSTYLYWSYGDLTPKQPATLVALGRLQSRGRSRGGGGGGSRGRVQGEGPGADPGGNPWICPCRGG